MSNYPNLEALGQGCVSGSICEWPMLKVEARDALDYIERLEAVVRAADAVMQATDLDCMGDERIDYDAARALAAFDAANGGSKTNG